jgi:hypothetical protein
LASLCRVSRRIKEQIKTMVSAEENSRKEYYISNTRHSRLKNCAREFYHLMLCRREKEREQNVFFIFSLKTESQILSTSSTKTLLLTATGCTTAEAWLISLQGQEVFLCRGKRSFSAGAGGLSLLQRVHTGSEAQSASNSVGNPISLPGAKWPKREAHYLSQSKAQVKSELNCTYNPLPHTHTHT